MSLAVVDRDDVVLRGRLSAPAELRVLPSGDPLVVFRLVVERDDPRPQVPATDTITCISFLPALRRYAVAWAAADLIEVEGALQRRFWRTVSGTGTTYEVDCRRGRKVARAGTGSPARTA
ncbi:single-stranded DNA-binding protein [Modestobacter sp. I12A-02628]|uniref:Single-stranded DNA-binding protein n=1 Tax=Goekera deserti TaxID=2497753 RepID=A0A7K3WEC2_9ACTN|nr:single-stranded DNA-binding protein [Goekera deserti]MPQ99766.1 single-stranded DNA-binding protein [Goekera deserti]NDI46223.1 single-stranded DNA-binding protein [Goekera deserti]NEL54845.1 single-stranded DNA-binding protein [Goekera deserti]